MSSSKECISSQWLINIKPDTRIFQNTIEIIFEQPGIDGNFRQIILSKNKNNKFKQLCRAVIQMMNIFNGISYAYDGRTILYSPIEIISNEMNFEWIQPHLPQILRDRFPNSDGILKVKIYPTKNFLLSDFSKSLNGLSEDRSWRSVVEVVLSEYAITRENDSYMMMRSGAMFETGEHEFKLGLVWREGNKKGVHIIKEQNVTQMCLAMDYQKIVFFPNNENFLKFLKTFIKNNFGNLNEAEKLCNGLLLSPLNNPRRILCFKEFKNVGHGILPKAVMVKMMDDEIFELNELIINADQKVTIDFLGDKFKEEVLQLNRLPAFRRILLIDEQLRRLQLNNPCTKAFGIFVQEEMLRGSFEILPPMNTVGAMNYQLTPFETGSFQLKPQNYFKKAVLDYVVILASEQDYHRTLKEIQKILKHISRNYMQMIKFEEFNLFSQSDNEWIAIFEKIITDYGIERTLVLEIGGPRSSHYFLKYFEAITGLHTQHIMVETIEKADLRTQQLICHKLNVKMGGLNVIVNFGTNVKNLNLNSNKIIVAAIDVCHATGANYKGETTEVSTIGLSVNNGKHPQEFYGSFFYGETRDEIIENTSLEKYIQIQFQEALKYRNEIETIAVIRDGIDEGRFLKVVEEEVQAIKTAAKNLGIDAKFVVFLINKKTNARHFQINKESNIITSMPPRSFISFGTRYMFKQIFMTAHRSITGTAVNTLITLPHDEIGISKAEGQEFLLGLCYLHQVVNAPISIPTSLHQADEIAFRGQYLYRKMYPPYKNYEREKLGNDELTRLLNFGDSLIPGTRYNA